MSVDGFILLLVTSVSSSTRPLQAERAACAEADPLQAMAACTEAATQQITVASMTEVQHQLEELSSALKALQASMVTACLPELSWQA